MFTKIEVSSLVGPLVVVTRGAALVALAFGEHWPKELARLERRYGPMAFDGDPRAPFPRRVVESFRAYEAGDLGALDALPVDVAGTEFQRRVWAALRTIPPGETISYQELARRVGAGGATRAVGNANGKNPVALAIPCHRVIRADGSIGGYGGGLPRKRWLLEHERSHAQAKGGSARAYA